MENELLLFGILAVVGASGVAVGDMLLLGNPVSGRVFRAQGLDNLLHVSPRNMLAGHALGVLVLPSALFGVVLVYRGLEPAGLSRALPPVMLMAYMLVVGGAAHACFAYLGGALQLQKNVGEDSRELADTLVAQHRRLLYPLFGAFVATLIVSSIWFAVVVWTSDTAYPKWMALANPLVLFIALGLIESTLPAPIGGYVRPANGNISFAVFFALSTYVLA